MANDCSFWFQAASRNPIKLEKFIKAWCVEYYGEGPHLYRIFDAWGEDSMHQIGNTGLFVVYMSGTCAWSLASCISSKPSSYYEDTMKHPNIWNPNIRNARCINALCRECETGIDIFSEEPGCEFAEHVRVDSEGNTLMDDCCDFKELYWDQDEFPTIDDLNKAWGTSYTEEDFDYGDGYVREGGYDESDYCDVDYLVEKHTKHEILVPYEMVPYVETYKEVGKSGYSMEAMATFLKNMSTESKEIKKRRLEKLTEFEKEMNSMVKEEKKWKQKKESMNSKRRQKRENS